MERSLATEDRAEDKQGETKAKKKSSSSICHRRAFNRPHKHRFSQLGEAARGKSSRNEWENLSRFMAHTKRLRSAFFAALETPLGRRFVSMGEITQK